MNHPDAAGSVVSVAVAAPVHRLFDYLLPDDTTVQSGCRVLVPFGRSTRVGFVVPPPPGAGERGRELKAVLEVIDESPVFDPTLARLLAWAADYYQHPLGEVMHAALPTRLRRRLAEPPAPARFALAMAPDAVASRIPANAHRQRRLIELIGAAGSAGLDRDTLRQSLGDCGGLLRKLEQRGLLRRVSRQAGRIPVAGPELNPAQRAAVERIEAAHQSFHCLLVKGVTGSGKTEVYLEAARRAIARGRQVLVLVPEIALTPQLVARFHERLACPLAVLHSGLGDGERQRAWLAASRGDADVVLGTRLSVFAPLRRPGLFIVDEEHDASFKQQEGFRYNARDVAIKRAAMHGIPVVLGSATPSLESYYNTVRDRYTLLDLPQRAGAAAMPDIALIDTRSWPLVDGLSVPLLKAIGERIERGEQSLVFINRRGFAPVVMCGGCGWQAHCARCDALLTLHRQSDVMRCHHCGASRATVSTCPECGGGDLFLAGVGTERIESALSRHFPGARIVRVDRDTTTRRGALEQHLERVGRGEVDILVGTQILSKGHDFPGITLVGILNCDQAMYSVDFRAGERLFQLVTQVSGRAGRGRLRGQVLLQTRFPEHPCMAAIRGHDYDAFARGELAARRALSMPPFGHLVLFRAESAREDEALGFLARVRDIGRGRAGAGGGEAAEVMDPVPAPMERRAGRFRAQLMLQARQRAALRRLVADIVRQVESERQTRRVRWSIDVDPVDVY